MGEMFRIKYSRGSLYLGRWEIFRWRRSKESCLEGLKSTTTLKLQLVLNRTTLFKRKKRTVRIVVSQVVTLNHRKPKTSRPNPGRSYQQQQHLMVNQNRNSSKKEKLVVSRSTKVYQSQTVNTRSNNRSGRSARTKFPKSKRSG